MRPAAVLLLVAVAASTGNAGELPPFEAVRKLRIVEDRMAAGDHAAHAERRRAFDAAGARLAGAPADAWTDHRNVHAALVWSLAGGGGAVLERLQREAPADPRLGAVVALVEAIRKTDAGQVRRRLADIDLSDLEPGIAAAIALAVADRLGPSGDDVAVPALESVALRLPGTFFAEAASRRLLPALFRQEQDGRALDVMTRYFVAFPATLFAARLLEDLVSLPAAAGDGGGDRLADLIEKGVPAEASAISGTDFLALARVALLDGRLRLSAVLARRAEARLPADRGGEVARLYRAAAAAPADADAPALSPVDRARLDAGGRALLDAAALRAQATRGGGVRGGSEGPRSIEDTLQRVREALAGAAKEVGR